MKVGSTLGVPTPTHAAPTPRGCAPITPPPRVGPTAPKRKRSTASGR